MKFINPFAAVLLLMVVNTTLVNHAKAQETIGLTYSWGIESSPADNTATLSGSTTATATLNTTVPGEYLIRVTVVAPLPGNQEPEPHEHESDTMTAEHMGALALVSYDNSTHIAIQNGLWSAPSTWYNQVVPADNARVVIQESVTVDYAGQSDERLSTVRIDGTLHFLSTSNSKLIVDTLIVDPRGTLIAGTEEDPIQSDASVNIVIANNGDIDTQSDPMLLGRGIIALGKVSMHGEKKTSDLKVAIDPLIGDTQIELSQQPLNWSLGDILLLAGTRYSGWKWENGGNGYERGVQYHQTQDEILTITGISGSTVTFTPALNYAHVTPRDDLKTSIVNLTRNVSIATENLETAQVHHRGHVMFMHSDDIDVRYAAFNALGRTDKSVESFNVDDLDVVMANSNIRTRYPFHFHRTGISDVDKPAIAIGNVVWGSPGWGYVHHDSNAIFHDNASFDTHGAGFVAETGNEIGTWSNNIAIKAKGNSSNPKNASDSVTFDTGLSGDGFWFQGRMVRSINNIAASVNHGFVYYHRGTGMVEFDANSFMLPDVLGLESDIHPAKVPILSFTGNETFASGMGLYIVKANPNQGHDVRSVLTDFTAWEVLVGAEISYTSHYTLKNFDLTGATPEAFRAPQVGIEFGTNTTDMVVNGAKIVNFAMGVDLGKHFTSGLTDTASLNQYVVIDIELENVEMPYNQYDADFEQLLTSADLQSNRFDIELPMEMVFKSANIDWNTPLIFSGTKTDNIGPIPLAAGMDSLGIRIREMISVATKSGYYTTSAGVDYAIVEEYFSDRATGEVHKRGIAVRLEDLDLGNQYHKFRDATYNGLINLQSLAPIANEDEISVFYEKDTIINVLENDMDPDGDLLSVDGIIQPAHGQVFDNHDGTVTYRADFDYVGDDTFKYWVSDGQGNFSPATVTVHVLQE